MIKSFFCNFDICLLDNEDSISIRKMLEIDKLKQKNIELLVESNCEIKNILSYNNDFPFLNYIFFYDGTILYDVNHDKIIEAYNIGINSIKKILKVFSNDICIYTKNDKYHMKKENIDENYISNYKDDIYKIDIKYKNKKDIDLNKLKDIKNIKYKINDNILEITSDKSNNIKLLNKYCKLKNIKKDEIFYVGLNDIEMIKKLDSTYSIKCNKKELKSNTCKTFNDIIEAINYIIEKHKL